MRAARRDNLIQRRMHLRELFTIAKSFDNGGIRTRDLRMPVSSLDQIVLSSSLQSQI